LNSPIAGLADHLNSPIAGLADHLNSPIAGLADRENSTLPVADHLNSPSGLAEQVNSSTASLCRNSYRVIIMGPGPVRNKITVRKILGSLSFEKWYLKNLSHVLGTGCM
jgi:hypothetical protein